MTVSTLRARSRACLHEGRFSEDGPCDVRSVFGSKDLARSALAKALNQRSVDDAWISEKDVTHG